MADLEYNVADGIGTILLNRPEAKNAFTFAMIDDWAEALRSARTDPRCGWWWSPGLATRSARGWI